jgi:hypothetical protein
VDTKERIQVTGEHEQIFLKKKLTTSANQLNLELTLVSSDPDARSEPFEFHAIAFTQPTWPC